MRKTFVNAVVLGGPAVEGGWASICVPRSAGKTDDRDARDMAHDADAPLIFVKPLISSVATTSETGSFKPPFIDRLAAEDRCYLNGLAMKNAAPAHVTAVTLANIAGGSRDHRRDDGAVVDVASGEVGCGGLSLPHSPRSHRDSFYVPHPGAGEFARVNLATGAFEPIAFRPGYLRGLTFIDSQAIVGLFEPREKRTFAGLPLQERLAAESATPRCGLCVIDLVTGDVVHWVRISGVVSELYDVVALPTNRPSLIGFRSAEIRRVISVEG